MNKITKVKNVYGIKLFEQDFNINENNLIYASNGTGKTSFLKLLTSVYKNGEIKNLKDHYTNEVGEVIINDVKLTEDNISQYADEKIIAEINIDNAKRFINDLINKDEILPKYFIKENEDLRDIEEIIKAINEIHEFHGEENFDKTFEYIFWWKIYSDENGGISTLIKDNKKFYIEDRIKFGELENYTKAVQNVKLQLELIEESEFNIYSKLDLSTFKKISDSDKLKSEIKNCPFDVDKIKLFVLLDDWITIDKYIENLNEFIAEGEIYDNLELFLKDASSIGAPTNIKKIMGVKEIDSMAFERIKHIDDKISKSPMKANFHNMTAHFERVFKFINDEVLFDVDAKDINDNLNVSIFKKSLRDKISSLNANLKFDEEHMSTFERATQSVENLSLDKNYIFEVKIADEVFGKVKTPKILFEGSNIELLSEGEKTLLSIFYIEREISNGTKVILFDDFGDPFDYRFKHMFVNALSTFIEEKKDIKVTFFMHNFDFLTSLYNAGINSFENRVFYMRKDYDKTSLTKISRNFLTKHLVFSTFEPASIPFIRNTMNIFDKSKIVGEDGTEYDYSDFVHYRENCNQLNVRDVYKLLNIFNEQMKIKSQDLLKNYYKWINDTAAKMVSNQRPKSISKELKSKIAIALSIRIKIEELCYLKEKNGDLKFNHVYRENESKTVFEFTKKIMTDNKELARKINYIIPDYQHFDSRTYSPLIDTDFEHMKNIYTSVMEYLRKFENNIASGGESNE